MKFVGDCETDGAIRVEGTVEGSISAGGEVVIGPGGVVHGDVRARDATVAGTVRGKLIAESRLELRETGRLEGEVFAGRIHVGDGAVVNAAVHMGDEAVANATREASTTPLRLEQVAEAEAEAEAEAKRRTS